MTYINNKVMMIEEELIENMSNKHSSKIQDKKIWKTLRTHIMSRREKNKQAKADAEILRKKKCVEYQQIQENKLSLAQINGRLSQLKCRRDELEGEKRSLLKQSNKIKLNCEAHNDKIVATNNINESVNSNQQSNNLYQQHIYRPQSAVNPESGSQSLMMYNSDTHAGSGNQTLLVCSRSTINSIDLNLNNNVTHSKSAASLSDAMNFAKCPTSYNSNVNQLLLPNIETNNTMGKIPSPQAIEQQNYQQPYPAYKLMNIITNKFNASTTNPVGNQPSLVTPTKRNYSIENSNRPGSKGENSQLFNSNVWINSEANKNVQPSVNNYGSFYQPTSANLVNYCVNDMSSSAKNYSGTSQPFLPQTELSNNTNLMTTSGDQGPQQILKPISHHHQIGHLQRPMFLNQGFRNSNLPNNHAYHPKPSYSYPEEQMNSNTSNFQHDIKNINSPNTTIVQSKSHQIAPYNISSSVSTNTSIATNEMSRFQPISQIYKRN